MRRTLFTLCFFLFCGSLFSQDCPTGSITFTTQSQVDSFPINYFGCTTIDGDLIIANSSVVNLDALSRIKTINGDLNISNNPLLTSISGLSDDLFGTPTVTIGGDFWLKNNDALISAGAYIMFGGGVNIEDNDALSSLDHLTLYMWNMTFLQITNNPNLSSCVEGGSGLWNGMCEYLSLESAQISNNAQGCNSTEEIVELCFLPITLTDFQAKIENKTTLLTWQTATESNNAGFEIQRSADGINWEKIAWQDGQGTTTTAHTYTHRDTNPLFGTSYYRLKQVDFDGAFEYTDVVQVNYEERDISIFPNPVKNTLHIPDLNGENIQHISIYEQTGRAILSRQMPDNSIDVSALSPGMYILKIAVKGEVFCSKFIVNQ